MEQCTEKCLHEGKAKLPAMEDRLKSYIAKMS